MCKNLSLFVLFFIFFYSTVTARTIYVNALATGANDGSSWINAYSRLSTAMDIARSTDTVKVAEGTYNPTAGSSQISTFYLRDSMLLIGGYPSTGNPTEAQRDWIQHPTILSGTLKESNYSYNVVSILNIHGATMDGFIVRDGTVPVLLQREAVLRLINADSIFLRNLLIRNNYGDAIWIQGSITAFTNCVITHNSGLSLNNNAASVSSFYNCVVTSNAGILNTDASITIVNCDVVNNGTAFRGSGTGKATIKNSIFWNNSTSDISGALDILAGNAGNDISHCITQTYYDSAANTLLVNNNPRFVNCANPEGPDGKFFTADDGLQLTIPCSPALNAGDNSFVATISSDILGNRRRYNTGAVDLGAYERQSIPGPALKTVFVNNNSSNTGNGDGSSWSNAFKNPYRPRFFIALTQSKLQKVFIRPSTLTRIVFLYWRIKKCCWVVILPMEILGRASATLLYILLF